MPAQPAAVSAANRAALAALCLVLAGSIGVRVYLRGQPADVVESSAGGGAVDLGGGVFLPRQEAASRAVWVQGCRYPVKAEFVSPTPSGRDAPSNADDRTFYVYRGQLLGGRLASLEMGALHYARRALGLLRVAGGTAADELAVELTIPAGCDASPEDAMAALRREMR